MPIVKLFAFIFICCQIISCTIDTSLKVRSGTIENDYVSEPLSDEVIKFEPALKTSNEIVEHIKAGSYQLIYEKYFSERLKVNISIENYLSLMNKLESRVGEVKEYKELQWHFFQHSINSNAYLSSVKIVEYENSEMNFLFDFKLDSDYKEIHGIKLKKREGVLSPGIF